MIEREGHRTKGSFILSHDETGNIVGGIVTVHVSGTLFEGIAGVSHLAEVEVSSPVPKDEARQLSLGIMTPEQCFVRRLLAPDQEDMESPPEW